MIANLNKGVKHNSLPLSLTIVIPVKNEEISLLGCLNSIGKDFVQEIIVLDSDSTDKTIEIAKSFGATVLNFTWDGKFPKKRNWLLRNHPPTTKWVLFLDADEHLTSDFKSELQKTLNESTKAGYWLKYTVYFLGRRLKGGYPLTKLALFRMGAGEYERINETSWSSLDMEIHEHPILRGKIGYFKSKIEHKDFKSISNYTIKHIEYASWEAMRFSEINSDPSKIARFTWKQFLKYRLMQSAWIGPVYFVGSFIFLGGFLDGARGLSFALLKMSYFNLIYCKIKESQELGN